MIDFYIGRTPGPTQPEKKPHTLDAVQEALRHVREVLQVHRNKQADRRKNTRDRRRQEDEGVIVRLSSSPERRTRLDRRQKMEPLNVGFRRQQSKDRQNNPDLKTSSESEQKLQTGKKSYYIAIV